MAALTGHRFDRQMGALACWPEVAILSQRGRHARRICSAPGRHRRRLAHPVRALDGRIRRSEQPGDADRDARGTGRALSVEGRNARRRRCGRGAQAFARLRTDARVRARLRSVARHARVRPATCVRHEPRYRDRHRPEDRDGTDRFGHRRRRRHRQRRADGLSRLVPTHPAAQLARQISWRAPRRRGSDCGRATSSRNCPRSPSRTPDCRWARAAS